MPYSVVKQLVRYRSVLVALANAAITWVILIVAPLGLFAVILCTALVFLSSIVFGTVGDFALFSLLRPSGWNTVSATTDPQNIDSQTSPTANPDQSQFEGEQRQNLP